MDYRNDKDYIFFLTALGRSIKSLKSIGRFIDYSCSLCTDRASLIIKGFAFERGWGKTVFLNHPTEVLKKGINGSMCFSNSKTNLFLKLL